MKPHSDTSRFAVIVGLFALTIGIALTGTHHLTQEKIASNDEQHQRSQLTSLLDGLTFNNDVLNEKRLIQHELLGAQLQPLYIARHDGQAIAAVISSNTPRGYNGDITLLVAVSQSGSVNGIRITRHLETPGLGDAIELTKSDWSLQFNGSTLHSPVLDRWLVKRDAGEFDQITGATITSRAVVIAVKHVLLYHQQKANSIYTESQADLNNNE